MADAAKPVYLIDASSDPVIVKIEGRASFQNSGCLHDFFNAMSAQGKSKFVIDFRDCTSMDSTFLGVLAGAALQLRKTQPTGRVICVRVGERNLELIRNLGLHRLVTVDTDNPPTSTVMTGQPSTPLKECDRTELESAKLVLEAHENLIATDESNRGKFQDVLTFLKNRVNQK
jgi:anti-anti-sigma factor